MWQIVEAPVAGMLLGRRRGRAVGGNVADKKGKENQAKIGKKTCCELT